MQKSTLITLSIILCFSANSEPKKHLTNQNKTRVKKETLFQDKERENLKFNTHLFNGLKEKELGNYEKALESFKACMRLKPNESVSFYESARINQRLGNIDLAIEEAKKACELNPNNKWYTKLYAEILMQNQKFNLAINEYKKLIKQNPKNQENYFLLAESYIYARKYLKAINVYDQIESQAGINKIVSMQKYSLYMQLNKTNSAIKQIETLTQKFPTDIEALEILSELYLLNNQKNKALEVFREIAKIDPGNGHIHLKLANYYRDQGENEKSYEELKKAFQNKSLIIDTKIPVLASYLPLIQEDKKMEKQAYELCEILIETHSQDYKSYTIYGDVLYSNKEMEEAKAKYLKSIELEKNQAQTWTQIIFIQAEQNKFKEVLKTSEEALEIFPTNPIYYYFNGVANSRFKNHEIATQVLETGIEFIADNDLLRTEFCASLAECFHALDDHQKSDSLFEIVLIKNPENSIALNNYSYYLSLRKEKLEKAQAMSEKSNQLDPKNGTYQDTYAWILYQLQDYKNAEIWIQKALKNGSDSSAVVVEHYGDILFKLGKKKKAIEQWRNAQELGGKNEKLIKKIKDEQLYE